MDEMNDQTLVGSDFTAFAEEATPRLRQALIARLGSDRGTDGLSHALAYAWEHWDKLQPMENPVGYLYRVGVSRGEGTSAPHTHRLPCATGAS